MHCGLLGRKLGHSYSPRIHKELGSYTYNLYEVEPEDLGRFFADSNFTGINVTIPYKKDVIPYCTELSPIAQKLGAVNTIIRKPDGRLIGHNTDHFGFRSMLQKTGLTVSGKKALVLGTGGASATACAVLKEQGANVVVISRTGENNYKNLSKHHDASLIVNATPVGMYPQNGISPVDLSVFPHAEGILDLIYNPARTQLILDAQSRNLITENGLWMLVAQAKESAEWFSGKSIPDESINSIHSKLEKEMQNIILVGMPGSGKTTIGAMLAEKLGRRFIDADIEIENAAGVSIPEIFAKDGEAGFREIETNVLSDLGKRSGIVLSTGGGCVTRECNYPLLHQNGVIIWLQRRISDLPTDGRPLSQKNRLDEMYIARKPLYERFADFTVENDNSCDETITQILSLEDIL